MMIGFSFGSIILSSTCIFRTWFNNSAYYTVSYTGFPIIDKQFQYSVHTQLQVLNYFFKPG